MPVTLPLKGHLFCYNTVYGHLSITCTDSLFGPEETKIYIYILYCNNRDRVTCTVYYGHLFNTDTIIIWTPL